MAKVKIEELGSIWGTEINEIRLQHVQKVKSKYKLSGYDLMLQKSLQSKNK